MGYIDFVLVLEWMYSCLTLFYLVSKQAYNVIYSVNNESFFVNIVVFHMPAKRVIRSILPFLLFGLDGKARFSFFCSGLVSSLKIHSITF